MIDANPQVACDGFAVERKSGTGQRSATKRHHVDSRACFGEPLKISSEHFKVCEQIVRPQNRLGATRMRVSTHYGLRISPSHLDKGGHQELQQLA